MPHLLSNWSLVTARVRLRVRVRLENGSSRRWTVRLRKFTNLGIWMSDMILESLSLRTNYVVTLDNNLKSCEDSGQGSCAVLVLLAAFLASENS